MAKKKDCACGDDCKCKKDSRANQHSALLYKLLDADIDVLSVTCPDCGGAVGINPADAVATEEESTCPVCRAVHKQHVLWRGFCEYWRTQSLEALSYKVQEVIDAAAARLPDPVPFRDEMTDRATPQRELWKTLYKTALYGIPMNTPCPYCAAALEWRTDMKDDERVYCLGDNCNMGYYAGYLWDNYLKAYDSLSDKDFILHVQSVERDARLYPRPALDESLGAYLDKAKELITGDRATMYGDARTLHDSIAAVWSAYLGLPPDKSLTGAQVVQMMVLVKMMRENQKHKEDNIVDMIGYLGLLVKWHGVADNS